MTALDVPPRPVMPNPFDVDVRDLESLATALGTVATALDLAHSRVATTGRSVVWTGPSAEVRAGVVTSVAADLGAVGGACAHAHTVLLVACGSAREAAAAVASARATVSRLQGDYDRLVVAARTAPQTGPTTLGALHEVTVQAVRAHAHAEEQLARFAAASRLAAAAAAEVTVVLRSRTRVPAPRAPAPHAPAGNEHWWDAAADALSGAVHSTVHAVEDAASEAWDVVHGMEQYYADHPAALV